MRWIVVAALVVTGALAAVGVAALLVGRDELPVGEGELIAYSCKEPGNVWYAICVIRSDGTESRRLTSDVPATDPAWSPTVARSRSHDERTWVTIRRSPRTTSS